MSRFEAAAKFLAARIAYDGGGLKLPQTEVEAAVDLAFQLHAEVERREKIETEAVLQASRAEAKK